MISFFFFFGGGRGSAVFLNVSLLEIDRYFLLIPECMCVPTSMFLTLVFFCIASSSFFQMDGRLGSLELPFWFK